jgi:hypothetical protein
MRSVAGKLMETTSCEEDDWLVHMRPGWPGSTPSEREVERRGYGKLSAVEKVRALSVVLLEDMVARDSVVSGPERVKGADTFMVSV